MNRFIGDVITNPLGRVAVEVLIAVVVALVITVVVGAVFRAVARRRGWPDQAVGRLRRPFRVLLILISAWIAVDVALPKSMRRGVPSDGLDIDRMFSIATIAVGAWFVASVVSFLVELGLSRYRTDVADNRVARRIRTQVLVIRRVAIAAIVVIAAAAILLTFPSAQAAGASLLASAGLLSVIAGVAAQSTLGNVIAGVQLAFSGAIRVDDVVIANGEWGRIEEITLTYVVVHIWDDRRMVLPSTYFTTTPFENWTRTGSELMQAVEFDLDWLVDPGAMREEMHRILDRTTLWDGRVSVLQVTDAVGGFVHVRILVTAIDAPTLFDLRCFVREEMVRWLHEHSPQSLPRTRFMSVEPSPNAPPRRSSRADSESEDRSLFSGDKRAEQRARNLTGPITVPDRDDLP
ncbi:mechanosensitive ion channel family protein [uncultured Amnibacterium sp.]|uniref:mechanosensitive ion channel family protein n=1 Tax=uncultured Amnibacterium sp. TaxID=1631851 RepID=UPI0035C9BF3D